MDNDFIDIIIANDIINNKFTNERLDYNRYRGIYLFTNENIKGITDNVDFNNKSILTISSSGDHIFNMLLCGAKEIDCYDINVFTKYFYYLKEAAIRVLSYEEFFGFFFSNKLFSKVRVFDNEVYFKISTSIRDNNALMFWNYLFSKYDGKRIYKSCLFVEDLYFKNTYIECNNYLSNEDSYNKLKLMLDSFEYKFYHLNILDKDNLSILNNKKYDFIYLSNILDSIIEEEVIFVNKIKEIVKYFREYLNEDGLIGVSYLYCYMDDYWYDDVNLKSLLIRQKYFNDGYLFKDFACTSNIGSNRDKDALMLVKKR